MKKFEAGLEEVLQSMASFGLVVGVGALAIIIIGAIISLLPVILIAGLAFAIGYIIMTICKIGNSN